MRPAYKKFKVKTIKTIYKKKFSQRKCRFCGFPGNPVSDLKKLNNDLYLNKYKLAKSKDSWRVMPKDSCEVYRERKKRTERDQESNGRKVKKENSKIIAKRVQKKRKRKAKEKDKPKQRRRYRKKSPSCSCCSDPLAS